MATALADQLEALAVAAEALQAGLKAAAIIFADGVVDGAIKYSPLALIFAGPDIKPAGIVHAEGYTDKVGKVGRRVTPKEVNDAIHRVKENLGRGGPIKWSSPEFPDRLLM